MSGVIRLFLETAVIRPAAPDDIPALLALAEASTLFQPDELEFVAGMIRDHLGGAEGDHRWAVDDDAGEPVGLAYFAPERLTDGTWNLYLIAVHPTRQRQGRGTAMVRHVEAALATEGVRIVLVETSGQESFEPTREFYRRCGYAEEARIREFYKAGDDKIVFRKVLGAGR